MSGEIATLFDGITRHSPEGTWFKDYAEDHGFAAEFPLPRRLPRGFALIAPASAATCAAFFQLMTCR